GLAEGPAKLAAEVRGREVRRARQRADVERLAVARVDQVLRAEEVAGRRDGRHRHQSWQMSATCASAARIRSAALSRTDCSCEPASSTIEPRSASRLSTTTGSLRAPPTGGTVPSSKSG